MADGISDTKAEATSATLTPPSSYGERMNPGKIGAAVMAVALTASACGGSDEGGAGDAAPASESSAVSESPTPTEASPGEDELEAAYRSYIEAFLTGDGATAYQLLSQRCRDSEPLSEFAAVAESAAELYGKVDYTIESVTVDGDTGKVDATYAAEALNSGGGSEWVYEDGGWHSDKCD